MTMTRNPASGALSRRTVLLGAGAAAALAGCGGGSAGGGGGAAAPQQSFSGEYTGPNVELAYWNGFTGGDGPFMKSLVDQFNSEHPNIKITSNTIRWADFYQRVPAAVNAGQGPDVGVMHQAQLATNAARRVIVPIDDVAESLGLSGEDFPESVWNAGIYQDQRYGIPLDVHSLAMYYNTEHFQAAGVTEPPTDAASFEQALQALKGNPNPQPFWMPTLWPAHLMFLSLLWQNSGEPYAEDGRSATFDSPEGVEALSWMVDQVQQGYSPKNVAIDAQYAAFKNGQNSVTWDGIWQINDLKAASGPYELAPLPKIFGTDAAWADSHNFFITRQASQDENKAQAARVFIDWISRRSAEWAGSGMVPARASVREEGALEGTQQQPIADKIDSLHFLPSIPGVGDVQAQTLEIGVNEAVLGKKSPQQALGDAATKATELMEANAEQYGS